MKKYRREIFTRGCGVVGLLVGLLVGVLVRPLVCLLVRPTCENSVLKISELSARCKRCHLFGFYTKQKAIGGPDVPQRRYNELLACPKLLNEPTDKWKRAKAIIAELTEELEKL